MERIGISSSTMAIRRMRRTAGRLVLAACMLGAFAPRAAAADPSSEGLTVPDRRRDQFPKEFGYAAFPYPYRLPGIGSGLSLVGGALNIADTYTDAYGIVFEGDVKGGAAGVGDIHLIPRTLILDLGYSSISKAAFQSYAQRGMNTAKDDFRLLELGDTEYYGARMTATFFERRGTKARRGLRVSATRTATSSLKRRTRPATAATRRSSEPAWTSPTITPIREQAFGST